MSLINLTFPQTETTPLDITSALKHTSRMFILIWVNRTWGVGINCFFVFFFPQMQPLAGEPWRSIMCSGIILEEVSRYSSNENGKLEGRLIIHWIVKWALGTFQKSESYYFGKKGKCRNFTTSPIQPVRRVQTKHTPAVWVLFFTQLFRWCVYLRQVDKRSVWKQSTLFSM